VSAAHEDAAGVARKDRTGEAAGSSLRALRAPSMSDVATLAGVSHQTVSRVLAEHPNVRPRTRARVLAAIDELGYRPNTAARALATGRSRTLGVVSMNSTLYGPASTLYSIEEAAKLAGYFVTVASVRSLDRVSLREATGRLLGQAVDGLVVIAPLASAADALRDLPKDTPVVAVEGDPAAHEAVVRVDQVTGAEVATRHLLDLGHATVWHVAGPADWLDAQGRITGWRRALEQAGAEVPPLLNGDWSARSGYQAGQVLARMPEVTAVFAGNDQMALGVLRALGERGRLVPADVSIVGFDDIPEAAFFAPPLTTVRQDFDEVGRLSLHMLVEQITEGSSGGQHAVVDTNLIVRDSTAPPHG
jgi:DNA-binding LacI/PurR family transcriptional regulator